MDSGCGIAKKRLGSLFKGSPRRLFCASLRSCENIQREADWSGLLIKCTFPVIYPSIGSICSVNSPLLKARIRRLSRRPPPAVSNSRKINRSFIPLRRMWSPASPSGRRSAPDWSGCRRDETHRHPDDRRCRHFNAYGVDRLSRHLLHLALAVSDQGGECLVHRVKQKRVLVNENRKSPLTIPQVVLLVCLSMAPLRHNLIRVLLAILTLSVFAGDLIADAIPGGIGSAVTQSSHNTPNDKGPCLACCAVHSGAAIVFDSFFRLETILPMITCFAALNEHAPSGDPVPIEYPPRLA